MRGNRRIDRGNGRGRGLFASSPPAYVSTTIEGGDRSAVAPGPSVTLSMLERIKVTFDQPVSVSAGAFTIVCQPNGWEQPPSGTAYTSNASGGLLVSVAGAVATITPDAGVITWMYGLSIPDGIWTLSIDMTKVSASGTPGGGTQTVPNIRRLFGDINDDGFIDSTDTGDFFNAFGTNAGDPGFRYDFDGNKDGTIDSTDFQDIVNRFGVGL